MGKYCEQCEKCGDETITYGWIPEKCPFCELAEARKQCDTLAKALSMYGLPYTDDDLEHMAQNPSPYTHEAKRELIRRKALAAVKGGKHECNH